MKEYHSSIPNRLWMLEKLLVVMAVVMGSVSGYVVTITVPQRVRSISFFKDGALLPKYLVHYDMLHCHTLSDSLSGSQQGVFHWQEECEWSCSQYENNGCYLFHIDTKNAIFDTIVIDKMDSVSSIVYEDSNGVPSRGNYPSVIKVLENSRLIWTGSFADLPILRETFDVRDFIRLAPLQNVKVIDTFPYNGDFIALFHVQYLFDYVDEFIIVESLYTHTGVQKPFLYFMSPKNKELFAPYMSKITYVVLEEFDVEMSAEWKKMSLAMDYITDKTIDSYWKENYQYRFANFFIKPTNPSGRRQIVLVCDADEITNQNVVKHIKEFENDPNLPSGPHTFDLPVHMHMRFFYYNFETVNKYLWQQAFAVNTDNFASIDYILNTRSIVSNENNYPGGAISFEVGWHLSYFMSHADITRKVKSFADVDRHDDFTHFDQEKINDHIQNCMTNHVDLFDRQDIVSRNWLGIEVVDSMQLERVLPAGYEVVAAELKIIQNIPI